MVSIPDPVPQGPRLANDEGPLWITEALELLGMNTRVPLSDQLQRTAHISVLLSRAEPMLGDTPSHSTKQWQDFFHSSVSLSRLTIQPAYTWLKAAKRLLYIAPRAEPCGQTWLCA